MQYLFTAYYNNNKKHPSKHKKKRKEEQNGEQLNVFFCETDALRELNKKKKESKIFFVCLRFLSCSHF